MRPGAATLLAAAVIAAAAALAAQDAHGATTIDGTEVTWDIADSKGHTYRWSMPVTTYEDSIVEGRHHVRDKVNLDLDGETLRVVSLDGFVRESFVNVIDGIYGNSYGNSDFIWEVWHVVSQLTVYDSDIHEYSEGRYALETLTRGGGDCEDLVILAADMLMSSGHTDGWTIQYVMMDIDNPTDPQDVDHVVLYVHDGEHAHFVEATAPPSWDYYPEGVNGWYLDVVPYAEDLDFAGQDLRWTDLAGRGLAGAVFSGARMGGADLSGADLSFADLSGADLSFADLSLADLSGADLASANVSGAVLSSASMEAANLAGADMSGADMSFADLTSANMSGADLSGTNLSGADLSQADLSSANLSGADMSSTSLSSANLSGAVLSGANLSAAVMVVVNLSGADLSHAVMSAAVMVAADLNSADLSGADLSSAVLVWADLSGADLAGADLSTTALYDVLGR